MKKCRISLAVSFRGGYSIFRNVQVSEITTLLVNHSHVTTSCNPWWVTFFIGGSFCPNDLTFEVFGESIVPIGSMYGIFSYIYHKNQPNVGKYTIHGFYGVGTFPPDSNSKFAPENWGLEGDQRLPFWRRWKAYFQGRNTHVSKLRVQFLQIHNSTTQPWKKEQVAVRSFPWTEKTIKSSNPVA